MLNTFKCELLKTRSSSLLHTTVGMPMLFMILTVMAILSSKSKTGEIDGLSFIQTDIYNLWATALLPIMVVILVSLDQFQGRQAHELQRYYANDWSINKLYLAKLIKFWALILLAQLEVCLVTMLSNLLTTGHVTQIGTLLGVSMLIWLGALPLISINAFLLQYANPVIASILNVGLVIMSVLLRNVFSPFFAFNPWNYSLRTIALLRINPNNTILAKNSWMAHDLSFIWYTVVAVLGWLLIDYLVVTLIGKQRWQKR